MYGVEIATGNITVKMGWVSLLNIVTVMNILFLLIAMVRLPLFLLHAKRNMTNDLVGRDADSVVCVSVRIRAGRYSGGGEAGG